MRKIDWTAKLTSRKFWAAIATFVSMMIVAIGKSEETATQVTSLIMCLGHLRMPRSFSLFPTTLLS